MRRTGRNRQRPSLPGQHRRSGGRQAGHGVEVLGARGIDPIYTVSDVAGASGDVGERTIATPSVINEAAPAVTDGSTIWFSGHSGAIARWEGGGEPQFTGAPTLDGDVLIAGFCRQLVTVHRVAGW